jgi:hypothetical protein
MLLLFSTGGFTNTFMLHKYMGSFPGTIGEPRGIAGRP